MVTTCESRFPPSPNLDKVTGSFDKLSNTNLFHQIHGVSVQFEIFIYTQIIAHDVHYRFEVVIGDVINKLLDNNAIT